MTAPQQATKNEEPNQALTSSSTRLAEGEQIVKKSSYWAAGLGAVPVPLFDLAAVTSVQLAMLAKLCTLYDVPFRKDLSKNLIGSLTGGLAASSLSPVVGSMLKFIPLVGFTASVVAMPALSGAATWAVGRVFLSHFESGGTLLSFNPAAYRKHVDELVAQKAEELRNGKAAKA